eukprot:219143-Rhodomonas_salina.1
MGSVRLGPTSRPHVTGSESRLRLTRQGWVLTLTPRGEPSRSHCDWPQAHCQAAVRPGGGTRHRLPVCVRVSVCARA